MDRFTRIYTTVLAAVAVAVLAVWLWEDPAIGRLNDRLAADPLVSAYPYRFRVVALDHGVATLRSPRSAEVPAFRALGALYPDLAGLEPTDPALLEAQQRLAEVQARAAELVRTADGVNSVRWQLDTGWLSSRGIQAGG